MPRFEIRLESPDLTRADGSPEYRLTRLVAEDEAAAVAAVERKEYELAAWQVDPEHLEDLRAKIDEHESDDPKVALSGLDRGHWFIHHQTKPYAVVDVQEIEGR